MKRRNKFVRVALQFALFFLIGSGLQGCIAATTIAVITALSVGGGHTVTVEVHAPADDVYAAMNRVLDRRQDVKVEKRDDKKRKIKASKGKNEMKAEVKELPDGMAKLIVRADAGEEDRTDEELALTVVEKICDELGVKYRVVKK